MRLGKGIFVNSIRLDYPLHVLGFGDRRAACSRPPRATRSLPRVRTAQHRIDATVSGGGARPRTLLGQQGTRCPRLAQDTKASSHFKLCLMKIHIVKVDGTTAPWPPRPLLQPARSRRQSSATQTCCPVSANGARSGVLVYKTINMRIRYNSCIN